jgi:hypothetical protein
MAMNMLLVPEVFHLGPHITAAQFAVTSLPRSQAMRGTSPVPLMDGLLIVAIGAAFFARTAIEKQIRPGLRG